MNKKLTGFLFTLIFYFCYSVANGQPEPETEAASPSDTLYIKYDAILTGFSYSGSGERVTFAYVDQTMDRYRMDFDLELNAKVATGISARSKYGSAFLSIRPLNDILNKSSVVRGSASIPKRRSFGFTLYPEQLMVNGRFTKITGGLYNDFDSVTPSNEMYEHYTMIENFKSVHLTLGATYFFNKKFSFSKANSSLYFPKKSVFTWIVSSQYFYRRMHRADTAFLPGSEFGNLTGDNIYYYYNFNYADDVTFTGFDIVGGFEFFLTRNRIKKPNKGFPGYYHLAFTMGPAFCFGKLDAIEGVDQQKLARGFHGTYIHRLGYNMRMFYLELAINVYLYRYKLRDYTQLTSNTYFGLVFGYRIPFKKGYEKGDKYIGEWKEKLKGKF
jgi:hypothetical protein